MKMESSNEVEVLSVVPANADSGNRLVCERCGTGVVSSKLMLHHQLMICNMRTPSQVRHSRLVGAVAKLCGMSEMHVFALEHQAGTLTNASGNRQSGNPTPTATPATSAENGSVSGSVSGSAGTSAALFDARLEATANWTCIDHVPTALLEQLAAEAFLSQHQATSAAVKDVAAANSAAAAALPTIVTRAPALDAGTQLSPDVLQMPQHRPLFERLRREAVTAAAAASAASPPPLQASLAAELQQQAEQLINVPTTSVTAPPPAAAATATAAGGGGSEYVEWHYCHQCRMPIDRNNVVRHVHTPHELCGFCPFETLSQSDMMKHRRCYHQCRRRINCPLCRTRYDTPYAYRRHVLTHRMDNELLLPGELDNGACLPGRQFEWQCELCRMIPSGTIMTLREIRDHATNTCQLLKFSESVFNSLFPHIPPPPPSQTPASSTV